MSNEYKDWLYDTVQEFIIDCGQLNDIEYITDYDEGYLVIGHTDDGVKEAYFVWLDEEDGLSWHQINSY